MLPQFRLEAFFATWEFKARHHLTASDAETLSISELLAFAGEDDRNRWETLRFGYIDTRGTMELRDAVGSTYSTIGPENILCFAGAEEGMYCAMHALLAPQDHAIVLVPNYQSMESIPQSICAVTGVALHEGDGWSFNADDVLHAVRPNTRLVAVNFPNNPTGSIAPHSDFAELVALCAERNIYLLSDEVYRGVERTPSKRLPQAADLYERAFSLNAVSKAYGLPGLRVAWIASRDAAALERMAEMKHYLSICNSAPSEVLATIALKAREPLLARNSALIAANIDLLTAFFDRYADFFQWYEPDGGCVAFPRYLGKGNVEGFCRGLMESEGVLLLPGSICQSALAAVSRDRFRIGFGRRGMEDALAAFARYLDGHALF